MCFPVCEWIQHLCVSVCMNGFKLHTFVHVSVYMWIYVHKWSVCQTENRSTYNLNTQMFKCQTRSLGDKLSIEKSLCIPDITQNILKCTDRQLLKAEDCPCKSSFLGMFWSTLILVTWIISSFTHFGTLMLPSSQGEDTLSCRCSGIFSALSKIQHTGEGWTLANKNLLFTQ